MSNISIVSQKYMDISPQPYIVPLQSHQYKAILFISEHYLSHIQHIMYPLLGKMSPRKIVKRTNVTWTKCHLENFIRKNVTRTDVTFANSTLKPKMSMEKFPMACIKFSIRQMSPGKFYQKNVTRTDVT